MSIKQIQDFLVPYKGPSQNLEDETARTWYFMYDHHFSWVEFKRRFPGSKEFGLGWLRDWTWHINEQGIPILTRPTSTSILLLT